MIIVKINGQRFDLAKETYQKTCNSLYAMGGMTVEQLDELKRSGEVILNDGTHIVVGEE